MAIKRDVMIFASHSSIIAAKPASATACSDVDIHIPQKYFDAQSVGKKKARKIPKKQLVQPHNHSRQLQEQNGTVMSLLEPNNLLQNHNYSFLHSRHRTV